MNRIDEQIKRMDNEIHNMNWRRLVASLQSYNTNQLTELKTQIEMVIKQKEQLTAYQHDVERNADNVEQTKARTKRKRIMIERVGNAIVRKDKQQ